MQIPARQGKRVPRAPYSEHKKCGFGHPLQADQDGYVVKDAKEQVFCTRCYCNRTGIAAETIPARGETVTQNTQSRAVATRAPKASELQNLALPANLMGLAEAFALSGYFQDARDVGQAVVKIQAGQEMGISPVAAMMGLYIVKGRIHVGSNVIATLVKRSGVYDYRVKTHTDDACEIEFYREGKIIGLSRFTQIDAKRAGLIKADSAWNSYPRNMLFARALSNGAKWFCPEVMMGSALPMTMAAPERTDDLSEEIDEATGEIIEGTARVMDDRPPEIHEPPEGYQPNWSEFWVYTKDTLHLSREQVHEHFGVPAGNGHLRDYATERANDTGKPLPQVVAEMREELRQSVLGGGGFEGLDPRTTLPEEMDL